MAESILADKAYLFALRIVKLSQYLHNEKHEYVISKKVLDSGTAIGVYVEEGRQAVDRSDFAKSYSISLKESVKTNFWLRILRDSDFVGKAHAESLLDDCVELQKMLSSSLKTVRGNI